MRVNDYVKGTVSFRHKPPNIYYCKVESIEDLKYLGRWKGFHNLGLTGRETFLTITQENIEFQILAPREFL